MKGHRIFSRYYGYMCKTSGNMEISFRGKRALVTGATKGIGRDIALQLSKCGAKVIAVGRTKDQLDSLKKEDPNIETIQLDIANWSKTEGVLKNCGPIDLLVNNAGIGRDIALQLSKCGAKVIAVGRTKDQLDSLKKEDPNIETIQLDIANWSKTEGVLKNCGPIDLLVNNAGMGWLKSMMDITEEDVDSVFGINIKALINVTKLVIKNLLDRNAPGSIVNLSSQASIAGLLHHTVYCASKGAVDAFTRAAALEYGPRNIRVNAVNPTVIMTDMGREGWSDPSVAKPMLEKIPLRRFGEVREVTDAVLYLLSDKSSMISGVCLPIDGGFTAC
ncbi:unnamed protein product [Phaedon cochleariae]|uniref:L-xylulose reductase n=1 Tax=Phaedon cochleariae TaxID=80249 RepID=A0A9P0GU13_PHACE|nr:unnamed protein product [Phaedon cochleariae]